MTQQVQTIPDLPTAIDLQTVSIDSLAYAFADVYRPVTITERPSFRWLQISTDVTILAEDVRREHERKEQAIDRALKVLARLLEFIGHYTYLSMEVLQPRSDIGAFVGKLLRSPSYADYFAVHDPVEGPTRWIYAKYPLACAKCGKRPCHCVLAPRLFENRRKNRKPYEEFIKPSNAARAGLRAAWSEDAAVGYLTLPGMFSFFNDLYHPTYYLQDHWKTAMHLVEEMGEATTELSRLELTFEAAKGTTGINIHNLWSNIEASVAGRLEDEKIAASELSATVTQLRASTDWMEPARLVAEKFKEELADVFSWLSAVVYQLLGDASLSADVLAKRLSEGEKKGGYLHHVKGGQESELQCPWCGKPQCSDGCLVMNAYASEVYESVAHF